MCAGAFPVLEGLRTILLKPLIQKELIENLVCYVLNCFDFPSFLKYCETACTAVLGVPVNIHCSRYTGSFLFHVSIKICSLQEK